MKHTAKTRFDFAWHYQDKNDNNVIEVFEET